MRDNRREMAMIGDTAACGKTHEINTNQEQD
jgi:hypothetical protein